MDRTTVRPVAFLALLALLSGCGGDETRPPPGDLVPPSTITDLRASVQEDTAVVLTWTSPADGGTQARVAEYAVRHAPQPITSETWPSAEVAGPPPSPKPPGQPESLTLLDLPQGRRHFSVRSRDAAGNWSAVSNAASATVGDLVPPGRVDDLRVIAATAQSVVVRWTAPGDDGATGTAAVYDIRYSSHAITEQSWDEAVAFAGVPAPRAGGSSEEARLLLAEPLLEYSVALKAADSRGNWSELSNVVSVAVVDTIPPSRVDDLAACAPGPGQMALSWTAPGGDEREGRAAQYLLRYAEAAITEETWDLARTIAGLPPPAPQGTVERFVVSDLPGGETYFFALRSVDGAGNASLLSPSAEGTVGTAVLRKLTTRPPSSRGVVGGMAWSPDGRHIAASADWAAPGSVPINADIFLVPVECGKVVRLTTRREYDGYPSWSPDGRRLAFSSEESIYIMDVDGGSSPILLVSGETNPTQCAWSPDGQWIAYSRQVFGGEPRSEIRLVPSAGGSPVTLVGHPSANGGPAWSPDGSRIAFSSNRAGSSDIWIQDLSGGEPTRLTEDPGVEVGPRWSPDGSRIAFTSDRTGNREVYIIPVAGGEWTQLTDHLATDVPWGWSPDGSQIAFTSNRTGKREVWMLVVD